MPSMLKINNPLLITPTTKFDIEWHLVIVFEAEFKVLDHGLQKKVLCFEHITLELSSVKQSVKLYCFPNVSQFNAATSRH